MLTESLQRIFVWPREVWGKWLPATPPPQKTGITRPRLHRGLIIQKKKTGIARPRPDGGVNNNNNKKSPRGINPAVVLAPLVPSMTGTSTVNSTATPIAPLIAIESLPAHRSADGYLLPAQRPFKG